MGSDAPVSQFRGRYWFLSNFYPASVELDGLRFPTVEHAYQAAKTLDDVTRRAIQSLLTPGLAKSAGNSREIITLRPDWEKVKVSIMLDLLRSKFSWIDLAATLLSTGDAYLTEGNTWGDTFWGVCHGRGENVLGVLLMVVRLEIEP